MLARRLVEHFEKDAVVLHTAFTHKIKLTGKCRELLRHVPAEDRRETTREMYRNLADWLENNRDQKSEYYIALGKRRARQGVPFHELLAAICAAREYFWEYVEREILLDPAEFWGDVQLIRSINECFDNALYFASLGYHNQHDNSTGCLLSVSRE